MFMRILLTLVLVLPACQILANEVTTVTSSSVIDAVTVFNDRAMVKRIFSGEFPAGDVQVRVPDLPAGLLNESIRVSGRGSGDAKISSVWIESEYFEQTVSEKIKGLESELDSLKKREDELTDRSAVLAQKKGFVENISSKTSQSISSNTTAQRPTAAEWLEMVNFVEKELDSINAEKRTIEEEKKSIADKKDIISKQLQKYNVDKTNSSKTAVVELTLDRPGQLDFNLSYMVYGATWKPAYDVRVDSDADTIRMMMFAEITQNTGEDWNNVNVELTTARPSISAKPAEPKAWIIGLQQPNFQPRGGLPSINKYVATSESRHQTMSLNDMADELRTTSGVAAQNQNAQWAVSDVTEQMISTSFVLPRRENILGNKTSKKVSVKAVKMAGDTEYFANPRKGSYAYLKSMMTNKTNFPFLEGPANVFLDGNFVHTTAIPLSVPGEKFDLYLGIDDQIRIDRQLVEKFADDGGMLSNKDKLKYSFRITVESFKKTARKITVLDQYPVSQSDQIEVKLSDVSPKTESASLDDSKGFLRWVFELKPQQKKEISFGYEIKYPDDYQLVGLQ